MTGSGQTGVVVRPSLLRRLLANPLAVIASTVLLLMVVLALIGPLLAPYDQNFSDLAVPLAPPSGDHLLGTDSAGRDTLSRMLYGTQLTLFAAVLCAAVAVVIGLPSGLIAGYYGGSFDSFASWSANVIMSLPGIIVLLAVRASLGPSVWVGMIIFGIMLSPGYFRLTRSAVQSVRNELYVDAARVAGLSDARIIARHIFSVVRAPVIIQTAIVAGLAISIQASLQFLGLGDPAEASWGVMLNEGFRYIYSSSTLLVVPIVMIGLTVGAFVLLANGLRDALEDTHKTPRRRGPRSTRKMQAKERVERHTSVAGGSSGHTGELLRVERLAVGYPQADGTTKRVVDDVSFHVERGEVLAIVGESGSGKSQSAFSVLGLLPGNAEILGGSIRFDGEYTLPPGDTQVHQPRLRPLRGSRIAYIPQEPMSNLDPNFTVGYQLARPLQLLTGASRAQAAAGAVELLRTVGIVNPERTYHLRPHEISGGMAQRVLIAGALSCEPDLIIADEPTTALDVTVQADILDLLRDLQSRLDMGLVIVTHNFGVVADLADRVVVMQSGRVVETGDVGDVLREPQHPYTQMLLGSMLADKEPMTMLTATEGGPRKASE